MQINEELKIQIEDNMRSS